MRSRILTLFAALVIGAVPTLADTAAAESTAQVARPAFVFAGDPPSAPDIFIRRTDGTVVQRTFTRDPFESDPAWSPDGRRIAFARTIGEGQVLFIMDANGANVRRLTRPTGPSSDNQPAWSPDGRRIAFARGSEIWRVDVTGKNLKRLTNSSTEFGDHHPAWSPDGRWIFFDSDRVTRPTDGPIANTEIFKMRPDGTGVRRLTRTAPDIRDEAPDVSPDGRRIVFTSTRANALFDTQLWTMRPDGSAVRRLGANGATASAFTARWTADGQRLIYSRHDNVGGYRTIWQINDDGTGNRRILGSRYGASAADPYPVRPR